MEASKLKEFRKRKGLTLDALAELVGTSKQTIQRYETGVIANIPPKKVEILAKVLDTTPSELMGWSVGVSNFDEFGVISLKTKKLPILGKIACGAPIYAEEEHESYISANEDLDADFCLKANGDSMVGARIFDGDVVFIKAQNSVDNGEIGAVIINDEATLKRVYFYPDEGKLILNPENPKYSPLVYIGDELNSIKIIGKAVAFQSKVI